MTKRKIISDSVDLGSLHQEWEIRLGKHQIPSQRGITTDLFTSQSTVNIQDSILIFKLLKIIL